MTRSALPNLQNLLKLGLREGWLPLDDLRQFGVESVDRLVLTPLNSAGIDGIKKVREQVIAASDLRTASKLFNEIVPEVCDQFERDHKVPETDAHAAMLSPTPMLGAIVSRCQYAVGHGGFHAGRVKVFNEFTGLNITNFFAGEAQGKNIFQNTYVYDCGSEDADAFTRSLQSYRRDYPEKLEILFVSHLHADHINRIDVLLSYKPARIVVLPYLDLEDIAAVAQRSFEEGHFSGLFREYIRDPVLWWQNRGVEIVIFIEPGGDETTPPESPVPDEPPGGGSLLVRGDINPNIRLAAFLEKPSGPTPKDLAPADPAIQDLKPSKIAILAGSGSLFRLEWQLGSWDQWRFADWILVPYVHPVAETRRTNFRAALLKHLKMDAPLPKDFQERLLKEIVSNADKLIAIYDEHFGRDHNVVSLSLYSGPAAKQVKTREQSWHIWDMSDTGRRWDDKAPTGWLSTGDSMLKEEKRRRPWGSFYSQYNGNIGILTLPHHGSVHNFHEDILNWNGLRVAVATTVKGERRIAGSVSAFPPPARARSQGRAGCQS
jgi:Metallo-beta-lactamase superfamily